MNIFDSLIIVLATTVGAFGGPYIRNFFGKKGENLATKQDISEITKRQEEIKHRFNELIETSNLVQHRASALGHRIHDAAQRSLWARPGVAPHPSGSTRHSIQGVPKQV
ncbi:hypothetical protein [Cupriavidus sp. CuC1]|uniref:hypothetical protein n=1 Tax=Cupriavidus sp. CuC1 TaxID=3373131 RepID=UPI0037D5573F